MTNPFESVACIGCGVIGSAWAGLFAVHGLAVKAYDPRPEAEATLVETMRRVSEATATPLETLQGNVSFSSNLEEAVAGVDFVQESAPERIEIKHRLYADLDELVPPSVPVASSTSGLPVSMLQSSCLHPQRILVGHPINPPYAVELVEVVAGPRTGEQTIEQTLAFYRALGRKPVRLNTEAPGFVANRLQIAVLREALQMIVRDEATVEQIDRILMRGIGLRWAAVGLFGAYALNLPDRQPGTWLTHFENIGFGGSLVHSGDFSSWTSACRQRVLEQWQARFCGDTDDVLRTRDRIVMAINRQRREDGDEEHHT